MTDEEAPTATLFALEQRRVMPTPANLLENALRLINDFVRSYLGHLGGNRTNGAMATTSATLPLAQAHQGPCAASG